MRTGGPLSTEWPARLSDDTMSEQSLNARKEQVSTKVGATCILRVETASAKALGWYFPKEIEGAGLIGTGVTKKGSKNVDR